MKEAVNQTGEETPPADSPSADNQTTQPTNDPQGHPEDNAQVAPQDEPSEGPDDGGVAPKSRNRFQDMANTVREKSEENERLRAERQQLLSQLTPQQQSNVQFDPNQEYTVEQYQSMLAQAQNQGAAQSNAAVEML
jgi:hypothetical protein